MEAPLLPQDENDFPELRLERCLAMQKKEQVAYNMCAALLQNNWQKDAEVRICGWGGFFYYFWREKNSTLAKNNPKKIDFAQFKFAVRRLQVLA